MTLGIGIDTGGTYTDAVIYDLEQREVLAKGKSLTTKENLELGISRAIDALPEELIRKATVLSLSTTLATNACVENKGGRAKLILLGTTRKILDWIDARSRYGLRDEDVLCIDAESIFEKEQAENPDWFETLIKEDAWLSDAEALAVAEVPAMRNGAVCEKLTKEKLAERYHVPFVMSNELALGLNVMERGATALLNARLLPIIEEFLKAVKGALAKRGIDISEMIVRSDGSLMSDNIAGSYPVQTILSGPASSVIGARNLADSDDCLIIDMGGTTTDISIVQSGVPAMSERISIGGYRTQIKGVYIDTIGLGGDTRITASHEVLTLNTRRVQPLCTIAEEHPELIEQLQTLVDSGRKHTMPLHEVLYLLKEPSNPQRYTKKENELIEKLRDHPIMLGNGELDIYTLDTERLEAEGIIMRCGLTPTDIMHIRGDFDKYDKQASVLGAKYVMQNLPAFQDKTLDEFCEAVYDMVCRKLYEDIVKIMFLATYPRIFTNGIDDQLAALIHDSWETRGIQNFFGFQFVTKATLIGIGAPTHIFLPRVAEVLGADYVIPPHAEVANAVGAITADVSAQSRIRISPIYGSEDDNAYKVFAHDGEHLFETLEDAVEFAKGIVREDAVLEAKKRGAMGELSVDVRVESRVAHAKHDVSIELDTFVIGSARGRVYQKN